MTNRDKLPPPRVLANGAIVPPSLQVNELSLGEWLDRTRWDEKYANMNKDDLRALARKMGYAEEDIARLMP